MENVDTKYSSTLAHAHFDTAANKLKTREGKKLFLSPVCFLSQQLGGGEISLREESAAGRRKRTPINTYKGKSLHKHTHAYHSTATSTSSIHLRRQPIVLTSEARHLPTQKPRHKVPLVHVNTSRRDQSINRMQHRKSYIVLSSV